MYAVMTAAAAGARGPILPLPTEALLRRYGVVRRRAATGCGRAPTSVLITCQAPTRGRGRSPSATPASTRSQLAERARRRRDRPAARRASLELTPEQVSLAHAHAVVRRRLRRPRRRALPHRRPDVSSACRRSSSRASTEPTHAMYDAVARRAGPPTHRRMARERPGRPATVTLRDIAYGLGDAQAATTPRRPRRSTCDRLRRRRRPAPRQPCTIRPRSSSPPDPAGRLRRLCLDSWAPGAPGSQARRIASSFSGGSRPRSSTSSATPRPVPSASLATSVAAA